MAALPLVLISAISNAVLNLQLCIMNLTALNHRKRRLKRLQLLLMLKDLRKGTNGRRFPRARLFWVRPGRCNEWWDNFITQRVTAEEWKENFRMNRETSLKLCDDLKPSLEKDKLQGCECHYRSKNKLLSVSIILQMKGV